MTIVCVYVMLVTQGDAVLQVVISPRSLCCYVMGVYGVCVEVGTTNHAAPVSR